MEFENSRFRRKCKWLAGLRACPNVSALGVKFWRKLLKQLCAYPVDLSIANCCKMYRRFILRQSFDFTGLESRHLVTGANLG